MSRRYANPAGRSRGKTQTFCRVKGCGSPTRDGAFVCDHDLEQLADDLRALRPTDSDRVEVTRLVRYAVVADTEWPGLGPSRVVEWCPWPRPREVNPGLWDSLQSVIAGERGIDYRSLGGGSGGSVETGIRLNEAASHRAVALRDVLRRLVRECMRLRVDHNSPDGWQPASTAEVPAMAEWLSWRVAGLAHHEDLVPLVEKTHTAVDRVRWSVMPARTKQDLGPCLVDCCGGRMLADRDADFAECDTCGSWLEAQLLRDWLITGLEDRLVTVGEAADLATYLGLRGDPLTIRERVRNRLNNWVRRHRLVDERVIDWTPGVCPWPAPTDLRFRFGTVYDRLVQHEDQHDTTRSTP